MAWRFEAARVGLRSRGFLTVNNVFDIFNFEHVEANKTKMHESIASSMMDMTRRQNEGVPKAQ
jgi:hypothetical protein